MYATHPEMAKEWQEHTSKDTELPEHVKKTSAVQGLLALGTMLNKTAAEPEKPSLLKRLAAPAAAVAGIGTYAALRKFRPSAIPELRSLQMAAKDKPLEIATAAPKGRGLRSMLFGAKDIPHNSRSAVAAPFNAKSKATVLHHAPSGSKVEGALNVNSGVLPEALDDKYIFHQLMTKGTGGAAGLEGSVPRTELLRDVVRKAQGNPAKLREHFGSDFVIKPRTGSMSKAENLVTHQTPHDDPRLVQMLRNPAEHIIQEKIPIQNEYRVHMINNVPFTASNRQIPHKGLRGLWDKHMGGGGGAFVPAMGAERQKLMDFARESTKHLGQTTEGTNILGKSENLHHALDIASTPNGYKLIESNPTPGTLMNPVVSRKLQWNITGRAPKDVAALGGLGAATATGLAGHAITSKRE
jgi:hypothetical protein